MKTIGIIGAGNIGKTVAAHLLKAGIPVLISNSKGPDTLQETIERLGSGAKAVTASEAAMQTLYYWRFPGQR
jgi:predicted dinucleotide-binding enzyme